MISDLMDIILSADGDLGIVEALQANNPCQALATAESWRPCAAMHLWKSLEKII